MIRSIGNCSFRGLYDNNLDNYTYHARVQFTERGFKGKWVEKVVVDPKKECVHLQHYIEPDKQIHLGLSGAKDELFAVIVNAQGKVVTLFRDEVVSRVALFQKHYPDLDLFKMLNIPKKL